MGIHDGKPFRVLQVIGSLDKGGVECRLMDIYRYIDREKVQFDFAVTSPGVETQFFYQEIISLGGHVYEIHPLRTVGIVKNFRQWKTLFKDGNYKIVHAHLSIASGFPLFIAWIAGVPKRIAHARNSNYKKFKPMRDKIRLPIFRVLIKIFPTDRIYCSPEAATYIFGKHALKKRNTYFLPNAIHLSSFSEIDEERKKELRQELGVADAGYVLGTVGNAGFINNIKNHIFLVRAFHQFLLKNPQAILLIVGDDAKDVAAKEYVSENGLHDSVKFLGVRNNISEILQIFDVFLLPSVSEGAPGSAIEAQAANVPCILSDVITRAVDVGAGLVKYISLDAPLEYWAEEMLNSCQMVRPKVADTIALMRRAGYDVSTSSETLLKIYGLN